MIHFLENIITETNKVNERQNTFTTNLKWWVVIDYYGWVKR